MSHIATDTIYHSTHNPKHINNTTAPLLTPLVLEYYHKEIMVGGEDWEYVSLCMTFILLVSVL